MKAPLPTPNSKQEGFTLVELLIVIIFTSFLTTMVITFMVDFWGMLATQTNDNQTLVERANAGDVLRDDLNVASHLINQNSIADANPLVLDSTDSTKTHWEVIHAVPGNTPMPTSGSYTPIFYYEAPSVDKSKNFIMNGGQPYYDEFILYLNGSTKQLLLRTLVNPGATGDHLVTSCPPASASPSCPADDDISDDISSVDLAYYSRSGNSINWESSIDPLTNEYDGPDFPVVEVVSITLHLSRSLSFGGGTATTNETVIRVALRN